MRHAISEDVRRDVQGRMACSFFVVGTPAPQGSKTVVGHGTHRRVIEGSSAAGRANIRNWRVAVGEAAKAQFEDGGQFVGPTRLVLTLYFERPKSRPKSHHGWHCVIPDKDKVLRACFDGLKQGGLVRDDAQICDFHVQAMETTGPTGARFDMRQILTRAPVD
jgi:Holliday junction resolvase RusA-like endonuclease